MTIDLSRRRVMIGASAAAATTVATQTLTAGSASAAVVTNPYTLTRMPTTTQLHYMNRLGCGYSRSTFDQMTSAGSPDAWFRAQLAPETIAENTTAAALPSWFPDLNRTPSEKWSTNVAKTKTAWFYARDLANLAMLRRTYSNRPVFENMVDFWTNHFHIPSVADFAWVHRAGYENVIRKNALGRFDQLLVAASLHPSMLLYLDNYKSVKDAPNENQGRELLELHTVGRASGYTEAMVKDSAKILSGYSVDKLGTWDGFYNLSTHTTGPVSVLGFSAANGASDGRQVTLDYLNYLAHHPATALNIARKLARKFVADEPSTALVTAVAQAFRDSGTDIKATLRALVAHPDFVASQGALVRTPIEDCIATIKVLDIKATTPTSSSAFAHNMVQVARTAFLYMWPRPDGAPYGAASWASPGRMLNSFQMHWNLAANGWPTANVIYRDRASWLPQSSIRLDQLVDHLSRVFLGRPSSTRMLSAVIAATGYGATTIVTSSHPLARGMFQRMAAVFLDSPEHMQR